MSSVAPASSSSPRGEKDPNINEQTIIKRQFAALPNAITFLLEQKLELRSRKETFIANYLTSQAWDRRQSCMFAL